MKESVYRLLTDSYDGGTEMRRQRDSKGRYMGYEDYSGRNGRQIGFGNHRGMTYRGNIYPMRNSRYDDTRTYRNMNDGYTSRMNMTAGGSNAKSEMQSGMIGIKEYIDDPITLEEATEWAEKTGKGIPKEEAKKIARTIGVPTEGEEFAEFYAVMNALHSDYCEVFQKYGIEDPNLYGDLAKAWIEDDDAVPNKSAVYYRFIVEE